MLFASFLGVGSATVVGACRGPDLSFDCDVQRAAFFEDAFEEAQLSGYISDEGPYHVVVSMSEQGLNSLLAGGLADEIPFGGDLNTGTLNVNFVPQEPPLVRFEAIEGCETCVTYSLAFDVNALSGGGPIASGVGAVVMRVPLKLEKQDASTTALVADYSDVEILNLDLQIFGFDSDEHESLAGALEILMTEELRERYGASVLFEFGGYGLGNGEVELLARELKTFPDEGVMQIGLQTNLPLDDGRGLDLDGSTASDAAIGIKVDVNVFEKMARRMLAEGEIPRIYNESGNPDPNGNYGATISAIRGSDADNDSLESVFRVWRIDYGYCGYAEVSMPVSMAVEDGTSSTGLPIKEVVATPGAIQVVRGAGVGSVAARDDELVAEQEPLIDIFKTELADTLEQTLAYKGLDLPGARVRIDAKDIIIDSSRVWMGSDFVVFEDP